MSHKNKLKITYSCGHSGIEIIREGMKQSEIRKTLYLLSKKICKQCWLDHKSKEDELFIKTIKRTSGFHFPDLIGTENQIAWAEMIRAEIISYIFKYLTNNIESFKQKQANFSLRDQFEIAGKINAVKEAARLLLEDEEDAKFWIDKRHLPFMKLVEAKIRHYGLTVKI